MRGNEREREGGERVTERVIREDSERGIEREMVRVERE